MNGSELSLRFHSCAGLSSRMIEMTPSSVSSARDRLPALLLFCWKSLINLKIRKRVLTESSSRVWRKTGTSKLHR